MKQSLIKYVQILTVQNLYLPLISDVISVEVDSVIHVRVVALIAQAAHRKISFLWSEFFGVLPSCRMNSNFCFPSLLWA